MANKNFQLTLKELKQKYGLDNTETGLKNQQVKERLEKYGPNELKSKQESKLKLFLRQFNNVIIYILIFSAILTLMMQRFSDATVIILVIIINAIIGYYQEANASNALERIKSILSTETNVYRDGKRINVPTKELVIGDEVFLEAGDKVPADLRLIDTDNLRIQESSLTGESDSIEKNAEVIKDPNQSLGDQTNIAFSHTSVTSGSATGIVVATGENTQMGQISTNVTETKSRKTPLMKELDGLGKWVSYAIIAASIILFFIGYFLGAYTLPTLALSVVAMLVGSIPEGLPAMTSVVLSRGVSDMAKNNHTIVKSLPAVETLGSVDVVATDKTGTLTKNEMTVKDILLTDQRYQVSGDGYDPDGKILQNDRPVKMNDNLRLFLESGYQANDTHLSKNDGEWEISGEPTDGAFLTAYHKGLGIEATSKYKDVDLIPFDSDFRYIARLVSDENGHKKVFIKGSPDKLFNLSKEVDPKFDMEKWNQTVHDLSTQGKRVIAVGYRDVSDDTEEISHELIQEGINFLGIAAIIDPPREDVIRSLKEMNGAGVAVKMITGDHPITAKAIGEQLELAKVVHAVTGPELDQMTQEEFEKAVLDNQVFARTTPQNKYDIIEALQDNGEVTAMTGDGINDAPALKRADIGVAMGNKGTDMAKDAADMVLTDDNFGTISPAIKEGRRIYDNIKKSIKFLLPTSFAEGLIIAFTILMQRPMPLEPTQLLWINMVSAITIQFAFIFEPAEKNLMKRKPRKTNANLLSKLDSFRMAYIASIIAIAGILTFEILTNNGWNHAVASTIVVNVIIMGKIFYLFNVRTDQPLFSKALFSNPAGWGIVGIMLLLQLGLIYLPFMHDAFKTANMPITGWLISITAGIIILTITEIEKHITNRMNKNK